ncbi:hypothetical protein EJB05_26722, partial [Eragrostis curvula]
MNTQPSNLSSANAVRSSKLPAYGSGIASPSTHPESIPLTVFDKLGDHRPAHLRHELTSFFHPLAPSTAVLLETGLTTCRVRAGRLGTDSTGNRAILLNNVGTHLTGNGRRHAP